MAENQAAFKHLLQSIWGHGDKTPIYLALEFNGYDVGMEALLSASDAEIKALDYISSSSELRTDEDYECYSELLLCE